MSHLPGISTAPSANIPASVDAAEYEDFLKTRGAGNTVDTIVLSYPIERCDALQWFITHRHFFDFNYYWEHPSKAKAVAALGSVREWRQSGSNRFEWLQKAKRQALKQTAHLNKSNAGDYGFPLAGGFSFFDEAPAGPWHGFPAGGLTLPRFTIFRQEDNCTASVAIPVSGISSIGEIHRRINNATEAFPPLISLDGFSKFSVGLMPSQSRQTNEAGSYRQWNKMISKTKAAIETGELQKVVLARARQLQFEHPPDEGLVLHRLRQRYPQCYTFLYKHPGSAIFIGSTPELLISTEDSRIRTEALAGSIARGVNKTEDARLGSRLLESRKDRKEHQFVKKQIINQLARFVDDLQYPAQPRLKKLSNVQHLSTPVCGLLRNKYEPLDVVKALHPTPAVGGVPRERSLQFIRENEPLQRGLFAGSIGWITSNRQAEFAVALRSGLINDRTARLFAGCGILADSDPQQEWDESELKFRPMLSALNYD